MSSFIPRTLGSHLKELAGWFPVVSLTGPRQSGKSTLARHAFPDYAYVNLEDPQLRAAAIEDPVSFIRQRPERLIIDEAQYAPDLFSMIQTVSDERGTPGQYLLTGPQNFLMMKRIGQSLAGRVGLSKLPPLTFQELQEARSGRLDVEAFMLSGGYPRLAATDIPPRVYFPSYLQTYLERDVAELLDVRNLEAFRTFVRLCAHNVGNLLNVTRLAGDAGVSLPTAKSWLSILESSYAVFTLQPFHANLRKRLTKTPKLYFYDTGLLCHLLRIETVEQLLEHPQFGAVFENLIVAETLKGHLSQGREPQLYFYRDDSKREIDLIDATMPGQMRAAEVKSSRTYHNEYARQLNAVCDEIGIDTTRRFVVTRVDASYRAQTCNVAAAQTWLAEAGNNR